MSAESDERLGGEPSRLAVALDPGPFTRWISRGWSIAGRHLLWAVFPLLTTLLAVFAVEAVLTAEGTLPAPQVPVPTPLVDLWTVVALPVGDAAALADAPLAATVPVSAALTGVLAGAYLGSLDDLFDHQRPSIRVNLWQYALPVGVFTFVVSALDLAATLAVSTTLLAAPIVLPLWAWVLYRFWATPFVVVAGDQNLVAALRTTWEFGGSPGSYRQFSVWLFGTTALLSVAATYGVVTYAPVGLVVGAIILAPLGLTLSAGCLGFVRSLLATRATAES